MACGKVSMELPKQMKSLNGSKAYIITGHSLKTKTPVVSQIETILGSSHVGTLSSIGQHAPVKGIINGMKAVEESGADILISIGGGSPIDSAKAIIYRLNEKNPDVWLPHIAIPTTLSAAECTSIAGYTTEDDRKTAVQNPHLSPSAIIYDAELGKYTPQKLWLSSGLRALDHAIESLYHPEAVDIPTKRLALEAIRDLFNYLPKSKEAPEDLKIISHLQTAAFASLGTLGQVSSGIGLSHSLGYALGSSYGIPHGITSCLTLSSVIELKSKNEESASQLARALP
ncbi:unnamed protein product [Didymodactylos carnosus]|nr:unnamed protein product [Didymodactylos carnosus]CAF3736226.1 unnamed protein product [Didymodactylos carnosus]